MYHFNVLKDYIATGVLLCSVHATSPYDIWAGGADGFVCHWSFGVDVHPASVGQIKAIFGEEYILSTPPEEKSGKFLIGK